GFVAQALLLQHVSRFVQRPCFPNGHTARARSVVGRPAGARGNRQAGECRSPAGTALLHYSAASVAPAAASAAASLAASAAPTASSTDVAAASAASSSVAASSRTGSSASAKPSSAGISTVSAWASTDASSALPQAPSASAPAEASETKSSLFI